MNPFSEDNIGEMEVANLSERYLIFIDETGDPFVNLDLTAYDDPSLFPAMTVTALIVPTIVYRDIMLPGLDAIKQKYFGNTSVYFHSREIRRRTFAFKIFQDESIYAAFKKDMVGLLERSSVVFISSSINKQRLAQRAVEFHARTGTPYNIGDVYLRNVEYVLERLGHFLKEGAGKILFEERGKKENKRIQAVLSDAKQNGNFYCSKDRFRNIDEEILFYTKKDNIGGLQLVDYCVYPFARHAKNPIDKDNRLFDILRRHVYGGDHSEYGLKEWP